jgi:NDP-hexose 4-ketoreductase
LIIDGDGMLATAFRAGAIDTEAAADALVFARGVARSDEWRLDAYGRELATLDVAIDRAADLGLPIVYFSGAPIYGSFGEPVKETSRLRPSTQYGRHQADCEDRIRRRSARHLILRLPNVVGPSGNRHQLVPALATRIAAGAVTVQARAARDLLDVERVVLATRALIEAGRTADTFNVAGGICTPVSEIVDEIAALLGSHPRRNMVDMGEPQQFDIAKLLAAVPSWTPDETWWRSALHRHVPGLLAEGRISD